MFKPKRPAFTELLPIHDGYVGGDDYFGSFDETDPRRALIVEVSAQEQDALRRPDQRRINPDRVLDSPNTVGIRRAILTFVVAVGVRQWQQREAGEKPRKYAMIIHNDTQRAAHAWQDQVIDWIFNAIVSAAERDPEHCGHCSTPHSKILKHRLQKTGDPWRAATKRSIRSLMLCKATTSSLRR